MSGELFKGIMQWELDWKGRKSKIPVFYYDNTSMTAIYTASTSAVKKLLPDKKMRPTEFIPGKSLIAFTAFEYRKTDIDPYNEFSISILVTYDEPSIPGITVGAELLNRKFSTYIWQLPVTTEIARAGGVELYGYPKFIADIDFSVESGQLVCRLAENGEQILTLRGNELTTSKGKQQKYRTYAVKDGITLTANVLVNPMEFAQTAIPNSAELELGTSHPIARTLQGLGLSKSPLLYQYSPMNEAILFAGKNLCDD